MPFHVGWVERDPSIRNSWNPTPTTRNHNLEASTVGIVPTYSPNLGCSDFTKNRDVLLDITTVVGGMFCLLFRIRRNGRQMAKLPITDFTYSKVQRLLQEACYDQAIAALSQRIEAQPQDRMARLLLLLANVSRFGTGPFNRQIDELRLFTDLSSNERHIVRQIFLVCFQHAERDGQTIQKIVYQRLIRRLMLNQPLDISISEARSIEQSEEAPSTCIVPAALPWTAAGIDDAGPEVFPRAPWRLDRWDEYALIGAGAMIIIVLLGFYVMTGRRAPLAQNPVQLISLASGDDSETEIIADRTRPVVLLAPTFTAEPARRLLSNQLGGLTEAYARWIEADPNTSGYVSLKLKIEPSGRVAKVEEVLSRLSEHRFLEVVIAEAKLWKLPHGGTTAAEVSVPLIFNPRATVVDTAGCRRASSRAGTGRGRARGNAYELRARRS